MDPDKKLIVVTLTFIPNLRRNYRGQCAKVTESTSKAPCVYYLIDFGRGEGVDTSYHQGLSHSLCLNFLKSFSIYLSTCSSPGKMKNIATTTLSAIHEWQANPLLYMKNYTPLVISGNDKNKKLTF